MNMWLSLEAHTHFWQKTISGASFFSSYYTTIPTFIFLVSSFCSIYQYVNKTRRNTGWKSTVVRNIKFQWIFFNTSRIWFMFLSCYRRLLKVADEYVDEKINSEGREISKMVTDSAAMMVIITLSIVPLVIIYANHRAKYEVPNFLIWIAEDPYAGHEMGVSGRFLDRPIKINQKKLKNYPYRSKKSNSFDNHPWLNRKPSVICQSCRSMIENKVASE